MKIAILSLCFLFVSCFIEPKKEDTITFVNDNINSSELVKVSDEKEFDYVGKPSSEGLRLVTKNKKSGFIDENGNIVIDLKYDAAWSFSNGLARVYKRYDSKQLNNPYIFKWGFINPKGEEIIPLIYDVAMPFENGKASVELNGRTFYIDENGENF